MTLAMLRDDWWWPWWVSSLIDLAVVAVATVVFLASSRRSVRLIACVFVPWGLAPVGAGWAAYAIAVAVYLAKLAVGGILLAIFETSIAKMRVFRVPQFLGAALMLGLLATLLRFVSAGL